jgi:hypothetical protein
MAIQGTDQERSAVTGAIGNEEGAPAPSFADVARKITGDDAPDWLVEALTNWGPCLMINRGLAVKQPTRSEMRKSLQAVRGAAACIVNALNNGATRDFLARSSACVKCSVVMRSS